MLSAAGKSGSCPGGNSAGHVLRLRTAAMVARPGAAAGENCGARRGPVRSAAVGSGGGGVSDHFRWPLWLRATAFRGRRDQRPEWARIAASDACRCGPPPLGSGRRFGRPFSQAFVVARHRVPGVARPAAGAGDNCSARRAPVWSVAVGSGASVWASIFAGLCGCAPQWSGCGETCGSSGREFQRPTRAGADRRCWDELSVCSTSTRAVRGACSDWGRRRTGCGRGGRGPLRLRQW